MMDSTPKNLMWKCFDKGGEKRKMLERELPVGIDCIVNRFKIRWISELPALEMPFAGQFWGGQFWVDFVYTDLSVSILDLFQLRLILMCPGDPKIENTTKSILSRWSKDYHLRYRGAPPHIHHQLETANSNFMDISNTSLFMLWGVFFFKKRTTNRPEVFRESIYCLVGSVNFIFIWTGST